MAIVTETFDLNDGTQFSFKYDDTVISRSGTGAYKHAALQDNFYTAFEVEEINQTITAGYEPYKDENLDGWNNKPFNPFIWSDNSQTWNINKNHYEELTYFGHVVLVYKKSVPDTTSHTYHLITEIDVSRLICHYVTSYMNERYNIKTDNNDSFDEYCDILNTRKTAVVGRIGLVPFSVTDDNEYLRTFLTGAVGGRDNTPSSNWSEGDVNNYSNYYNDSYAGLIYTMFPENDINLYVSDNNPSYYRRSINDDYSLMFYAGGRSGGGKQCWSYLEFRSENAVLKQLALRGLAFEYNGTRYYPVINGGKVTGYTEDIQDSGDYKNYDGIHSHFIPSGREDIPPAPEGEGDIETDMSAFQAYMGSGMVKYYYTNSLTKLNQIAAAIGNWDNIETGKDVLKNLISLKCFGIQSEAGGYIRGFLEDFEIAGTKLKTSATAEEYIQMARITSVQAIPLGSFEIKPKFGDFRDYAPYTKIEMFVPLCGWVALPSHCMGKTVSGVLNFDYINGSCIAHIYCGLTEVAQITGYMGYDVPFVAENVGVKMAGVVSGMMSVGSSVLGTAAGIATGNPLTVASGALGVINSVTQSVMSNNANYTEVHGRTGDGCNICGLQKVFIKIQRPISEIPSNYGAAVGYVANRAVTIAECSGLTVCTNVDTDGISGATASERDKIKALLETGIRV